MTALAIALAVTDAAVELWGNLGMLFLQPGCCMICRFSGSGSAITMAVLALGCGVKAVRFSPDAVSFALRGEDFAKWDCCLQHGMMAVFTEIGDFSGMKETPVLCAVNFAQKGRTVRIAHWVAFIADLTRCLDIVIGFARRVTAFADLMIGQ